MSHLPIDIAWAVGVIFAAGMFYRKMLTMERIARDVVDNHLPHIESELKGLGERIAHVEGKLSKG